MRYQPLDADHNPDGTQGLDQFIAASSLCVIFLNMNTAWDCRRWLWHITPTSDSDLTETRQRRRFLRAEKASSQRRRTSERYGPTWKHDVVVCVVLTLFGFFVFLKIFQSRRTEGLTTDPYSSRLISIQLKIDDIFNSKTEVLAVLVLWSPLYKRERKRDTALLSKSSQKWAISHLLVVNSKKSKHQNTA